MDAFRRKIIASVRDRPSLWDPRNPNYKDKEVRKLMWKEVEDLVKTPPGIKVDHKYTWDQLTRGFANALRRKEKRSCNGIPADFDLKWKFENDMLFLVPVKHLRGTSTPYGDGVPSKFENVEFSVYNGDEYEGSCHSLTEETIQVGSDEEIIDPSKEDMDAYIDFEPDYNLSAERGNYNYNIASISNRISQRNHNSSNNSHTKSRKRKNVETSDDEDGTNTASARRIITNRNKNNISYVENNNEGMAMKQRRQQQQQQQRVGTTTTKAVDEQSSRFGFFLSLMPIVESLDDCNFLDFQLDVLQALKRQRQTGRAPPTPTVTMVLSCDEEEDEERQPESTGGATDS